MAIRPLENQLSDIGFKRLFPELCDEFRREAPFNNVIIAHEFLHTLGASDKYDPADGLPLFPLGFAEPEKEPRFPQRLAEIMGGRIPLSDYDAEIPGSLKHVIIGADTALEIRLIE